MSLRRVLLPALALLLHACSDGGEEAGRDDRSTTTTTEEDAATTTQGGGSGGGEAAEAGTFELDLPEGGFRTSANLFGQSFQGEVDADGDYRLRVKFESVVFETIVVGAVAYERSGSEETFGSAQYVEVPVELATAAGQLEALLGGDTDLIPEEELDGILFGTVLELAVVDPAGLVDALLDDPDADVRAGSVRGLVTAGSLGIDIDAATGARVDADDGLPVRATLLVPTFGGDSAQVAVTYEGFGTVDPIEEPAPEEIDRTPDVTEEALLAFVDTPLHAPQPPPEGFDLRTAVVLAPDQTLEGCTQVNLEYEGDDDFLTIFVVPRACVEAFDDAPFDETFGGLPSRFVTTREVLLGETVVQLESSLPDAELEAVAASLQPITADALIASVVPG